MGADLPGAVGANAPKSKGSVGACTKRKNCQNHNYKKWIHCGQMIFRKISKIGATRCQILRLKCTKFDFRWGSVPDPAGGVYSAPPDPLAVFKGLLLSGGRGNGAGEGKRRGKGMGGKEGREWEEKGGEGGKRGGMGACTHWDFRKSAPR